MPIVQPTLQIPKARKDGQLSEDSTACDDSEHSNPSGLSQLSQRNLKRGSIAGSNTSITEKILYKPERSGLQGSPSTARNPKGRHCVRPWSWWYKSLDMIEVQWFEALLAAYIPAHGAKFLSS